MDFVKENTLESPYCPSMRDCINDLRSHGAMGYHTEDKPNLLIEKGGAGTSQSTLLREKSKSQKDKGDWITTSSRSGCHNKIP